MLDALETPPDILAYLARRLVIPTKPFPSFPLSISELGQPRPLRRLLDVCAVYDKFGLSRRETDPARQAESLKSRASAAVVFMVENKLDAEWLADLPHGVVVPIWEMIRVCQSNPDRSWSTDIFSFVGRTDLAIQREALSPYNDQAIEDVSEHFGQR